jgi:TonB family protein
MRERVAKAKAYIAVRNYNAAIYELENIRRETNDATVNGVINVLLMHSYIEQGDYKRAQDFLSELSKSTKPDAKANYLTVAAQVIKGAKNQLERYRALGLSVADRNLPPDAANDIEKMRQTLETVVEQSKVLSKDKAQTANAMALLEEATNARSNLAKDNFDATRWKNEAADAREILANSRSVVLNAVNDLPTDLAANTTSKETLNQTVAIIPVDDNTNKASGPLPTETVAKNKIEPPVITETPKQQTKTETETTEKNVRIRRVESSPTENKTAAAANTNPLEVGSLLEYATQKVSPIYPNAAKTIRQMGIVRVELIVDESGQVASVGKLSGPALLKSAAEDAVKKWKFKPFMRDGQPVKATGFVSFNFNL